MTDNNDNASVTTAPAPTTWYGRWKQYCKKHAERWSYKYAVNVSSGWLYYTTTYGLQELATGNDLETIVETRKIGMLVQTVAMPLIGLLRNKIAEKRGVTKESSLLERMKVNALAILPIQAFAYTGMLLGGMANTGNWDWKSAAAAWTVGMLTAVPHSLVYGPIQDSYRKFFGVQPAIKQTQSTTLETYVENK